MKKRPVADGGQIADIQIDFNDLFMRPEWLDLLDRVAAVEKRNIEQDERLTNNELRLSKLEKAINDPMDRILLLEQQIQHLQLQLNNKVNVQDLFNELIKKANITDLKALEANLIRLNEIVNDLAN